MTISQAVLKNDEKVIFSLRSLYGKYGYSQYKMNKFEEYDLYVRNKDFLISDNIITFTDTNGKLMALKPDVTLSIIKNSKDLAGYCEKVYYNENVYRVSKSSHGFKEIVQLGLECIGDINEYEICEVLVLAAMSLKQVSDECILEISHLGLLRDIMDNFNISNDHKEAMFKCIGDKNVHELDALCTSIGIDEMRSNILKQLVALYGTPDVVLPKLCSMLKDFESTPHFDILSKIAATFKSNGLSDMLRIDFSVVNDIKYYNGIVFKGFVADVPTGILSGGQYDALMRKMGRRSGAVGFAVYLDMLERLGEKDKGNDVDILLIYDDEADPVKLGEAVNDLIIKGNTVAAQKNIPEKLTYGKLMKFSDNGVKPCE